MPSRVALIVFLVLIFALLRIEAKHKVDVSFAIWLPQLWIMIAASRALSTWINPGEMYGGGGDIESGNPIDRLFFTSLIVLSVVVLARRRIEWRSIADENAWLTALFLFSAMSVAWSEFPDVSFKRWIRSLGLMLSVLIVVTEGDPIEASKRLLRRCTYILIPLSVLFIKYFRELGVGYDHMGKTMWYGVATHKNSLGQLACVSAIFLVWSIASQWKNRTRLVWADLLVLAMSLWLLRGSDMSSSKTSIFLFLLGLFLLTCLHLLRKRPQSVGRLILGAFVVMLILQIVSAAVLDESLFALVVSSSGRDATLTGRTLLWDDLMDIGSQNPILGRGYGNFWIGDRVQQLWEKFGWGPESAHNGFLDVYLEIGIVGLVLLLGSIAQGYRNIVRRLKIDYEYAMLIIPLFAMSILYNYTESSFLKPSSLWWIVLVLVTVGCSSLEKGRVRSQKE